jgi:uncharacterized protein (TIGR03437 family)
VSRLSRRIAVWVVFSLVCGAISEAHYHFIRFASRTAPWQALPEKFDLNALPNKTLSYFISDQAALQFAPSDTFAGLVSEIRAAAQVWNNVETSDLRIAFGGFLGPQAAVQAAPTLEVLFEELAPGVVGMGGPTVRATSNGAFVPILKSVVVIPPDFTQRHSYGEAFFGTVVHEFGHALGLQHTLTSGVMATVTRTTTKANPITADDIAGLSLLYPSRTFLSSTGSITGRVTLQGGLGVNLASIVAISPAGAAISTLTNPDGTYRIDGLPPRTYLVYVHPLPPPRDGHDIVQPTDVDGKSLGPGVPFDTVFFRGPNDGTANADSAASLTVSAGTSVDNINFLVRPRASVTMHSVETFAYPQYPLGGAVKPAYLSASLRQPFLVVRGTGLVNGSGATPGLSVRVLSGPTLGIQPFSTPQGTNLQLYFDPRTLAFSTDTPRHLVFSTNNDIYVLPAAFFHVAKQPPSITSVVPVFENGSRLAIVTGANLLESTRILFDGIEGRIRSIDEANGRLIVAVPPAPIGHRANVTALNADGQSSLFIDGENPPIYTYAADATFAFSSSVVIAAPGSLPAGTESLVQIDAANIEFTDGLVSVGFGTSDVVARRVWVVSPTRLLANVFVSPFAQAGAYNLTVASGLQTVSQPFSFQVQPANLRAFWLSSSVLNFVTQQPSVTAGAIAVLTVGGSPVTVTPGSANVILGDRQLPVLAVNGNQVMFQIPAGTPVGPVAVRLESGSERSLPIVVPIDPPPPRILSATVANQTLTEALPAHAGESISLIVADLKETGSPIGGSRVVVNIGGVHVNAISVSEAGSAHKLTVLLPSHSPVGRVPVSVEIDERTSEPIQVSIAD